MVSPQLIVLASAGPGPRAVKPAAATARIAVLQLRAARVCRALPAWWMLGTMGPLLALRANSAEAVVSARVAMRADRRGGTRSVGESAAAGRLVSARGASLRRR